MIALHISVGICYAEKSASIVVNYYLIKTSTSPKVSWVYTALLTSSYAISWFELTDHWY